MSNFFQPPRGSSGSRTIYTVLHERSQSRNNDIEESPKRHNRMHSPTPSSSTESQSGSSRASSPSNSQSPKHSTLTYEDSNEFDATDASQLDAFVPASLRHAIDAARYSSLGDFGTEICWEALPPIFGLPSSKRAVSRAYAGYIDDVPLLSELLEEQQHIVLQYLCDYRNSLASLDDAYHVAAQANLYVQSTPKSLLSILTYWSYSQTSILYCILPLLDLDTCAIFTNFCSVFPVVLCIFFTSIHGVFICWNGTF